MDYSTINLDVLRRLPAVAARFNDDESGLGCAGDPPGYPSYFVRDFYARNDQPLYRVLTYEGAHYQVKSGRDSDYEAYQALLRELWLPLPLDHLRTRLWIRGLYRHFAYCYHCPDDGVLIYPVPAYKKRSYQCDPRWKDEFIETHKAAVDQHNRELEEMAARLATPDNHKAVLIVRRFYPDYVPETDLIAEPPKGLVLWWETEAEQPSEEACAGAQRFLHRHPVGKTHCQFCGRSYDDQGRPIPYRDPHVRFARRT